VYLQLIVHQGNKPYVPTLPELRVCFPRVPFILVTVSGNNYSFVGSTYFLNRYQQKGKHQPSPQRLAQLHVKDRNERKSLML